MALPGASTNLTGYSVLSVTDLGLSATLAASATDTSVAMNTRVPATVLVCTQLTSGDCSVLVDRHSGTPNWDSPNATITLTDTTAKYIQLDTTTAETYVSIRQVDNADVADGTVFADLRVVVLYELSAGEGGSDIRAGLNAVSSTNGDPDGSGVLSSSLS